MKSARIIIACVLFTEVFTVSSARRTKFKNKSPDEIDSHNFSNSDEVYQTSNLPNARPHVNNGPNLLPEINNDPSQFNPFSQPNNGVNPFPQINNGLNPLPHIPPLPVIRKENSENEDITAPKNYFYSFPRANIIKIYYISGKSEPYDEPDVPVTGGQPIVGSSPIPTAAIASLTGGNFG
ncbi:uncharacterized protein [Diabrotica undecimpunctata]|uniref:uncharacterized protein n=1 Tax=Diabrotica undecimpunctata TaxID=50387 RepID=UPI003B63D2F6